MSQLSFVTDLSDAYEEVRSKAKDGKQTIKSLIDFFEGRANAEETFAKALARLPVTDEEYQEQSTVLSAWKSIYTTNQVQIQGHLNYALVLRNEVIPSLKELLEDLRETKKKLELMEKVSTKRKTQYEADLQKAKDEVARSTLEVSETISAIELKAKSGNVISEEDNELVAKTAEKTARSEELAKKVEETTEVYREEYKQTITEIMNTFQQIEEKRITTIKNVLTKQSISQKGLDESSLSSSSQTEEFAKGIDANHDVAELIVALREIVQEKAIQKNREMKPSLPALPTKSKFFGLLGKNSSKDSSVNNTMSVSASHEEVKENVQNKNVSEKVLKPLLNPVIDSALTPIKETIYGQSIMPLSIENWSLENNDSSYGILYYGMLSEVSASIPTEFVTYIKNQYHLTENECNDIQEVFLSCQDDKNTDLITHYINILKTFRMNNCNFLKSNYILIQNVLYIYVFSCLLWKLKQSTLTSIEKQTIYMNTICPLTVKIQQFFIQLKDYPLVSMGQVHTIETESPVAESKETLIENTEVHVPTTTEDKVENSDDKMMTEQVHEETPAENFIPVPSLPTHNNQDTLMDQYDQEILDLSNQFTSLSVQPLHYCFLEDSLNYRYQMDNNMIVIHEKESKDSQFFDDFSKNILHFDNVEYCILTIKRLMTLYLNSQKTKEISDLISSLFTKVLDAFAEDKIEQNDILLLSKISYQLVNPCKNNLKDAVTLYIQQPSFVATDLTLLKKTLLIQQYCNNSRDQTGIYGTNFNPLSDDLLHTLLEGSAMMYYMTLLLPYTSPFTYGDIISLLNEIETHTQIDDPVMVVIDQFTTLVPDAAVLFKKLLIDHVNEFSMEVLASNDYTPTEYISLIKHFEHLTDHHECSTVDYCEAKVCDFINVQFNEITTFDAYNNNDYEEIDGKQVSKSAIQFITSLKSIYNTLSITINENKLDQIHTELYLKKIVSLMNSYISTIQKSIPESSSFIPPNPIPPHMIQHTKDITSGFKNFMNKVRRPSVSQSKPSLPTKPLPAKPLPPKPTLPAKPSLPAKPLPSIPVHSETLTNNQAAIESTSVPETITEHPHASLTEVDYAYYKINTLTYIQSEYTQLINNYSTFCNNSEESNLLALSFAEKLSESVNSCVQNIIQFLVLYVLYHDNKDVLIDWVYSTPENTFQIAIQTCRKTIESLYDKMNDDYKSMFVTSFYNCVSQLFIRSLIHNKSFLSRGSYVWQYADIQNSSEWKDVPEEENKIISNVYINDNKIETVTLEGIQLALSPSDHILRALQGETTYTIKKRYTSIYQSDYNYIINLFSNETSKYFIKSLNENTEFSSTIDSIFVYMHMNNQELIRKYKLLDNKQSDKYLHNILLERDDPLVKNILNNK